MKKWFNDWIVSKMFSSRKFWYTVVGVLTTLLSEKLGLNPDEVKNVLMSIAALVLGQGIADAKK